MSEADDRPVLRLVRGNPSAAELAALVSVLTARARAGQAGAASQREQRQASWTDRGRSMRQPLAHGPGAWRASGLPR